MATQLIIRIDSELKEKLARVARQEGKTASQAVRELVARYVEERDISGYIDDLWGRIGRELKERGKAPADVKAATRKVRARRRS